jgi:CubicO group peptidase (beta-lactamase class C family)
VIAALEEEAPHWVPGEDHGYHPRTFGFLLDEIVRQIAGEHLGAYWRRAFAEPLQLEVWMGMDPDLAESVAPVFAARTAPPKDDAFYQAFATSGSFTARAFASPRGLHSVAALNTFEARTTSFGAFGGIGTAHSLAKFYALLASGGELDGRRFLAPSTVELMSETITQGPDRVLLMGDGFLHWVHARSCRCAGAEDPRDLWPITSRVRSPWRGWQPGLRRSGKTELASPM